MMKNKIWLILAAALCLSLSGCGSEEAEQTAEVTEAASVSSEKTDFQTSALQTVAEEEVTAEITSSETSAEVTESAAEQTEKQEYALVSEDNLFIDFTFIEDYKGTAVESGLAERAAALVKERGYYADSQAQKELYTDSYPEYFDENGDIAPKAAQAFTEDFDGDGKEESFVFVDMPFDDNPIHLRTFLVFENSGGEDTLLEYNYRGENMYPVQLLDYGIEKHIIIGSGGTCGADSHTEIIGVSDDCAKIFDSGRFGVVKTGCFLGEYGWQGMGGTMYYDTAAKEYRYITGEEIDFGVIAEMDSTGVYEEYTEMINNGEFVRAYLMGKKYYCVIWGMMDTGFVCTYENGAFVPEDEGSAIRYPNLDGYFPCVIDIDMNKALEEMISPEEAIELKKNLS